VEESNLIYINARPTHSSPSPLKLPLQSRDDFPQVHTWDIWLNVIRSLTPESSFPVQLQQSRLFGARPIPSRRDDGSAKAVDAHHARYFLISSPFSRRTVDISPFRPEKPARSRSFDLLLLPITLVSLGASSAPPANHLFSISRIVVFWLGQ